MTFCIPKPNHRRMARGPLSIRLSPDEWVALDAKRAVEGVDRSELIRRAVAAYVPTPKASRSLIPWDPAWGPEGEE